MVNIITLEPIEVTRSTILLRGEVTNVVEKTLVSFKYKRIIDINWIVAEFQEMEVDGQFYFLIENLEELKNYEFNAIALVPLASFDYLEE